MATRARKTWKLGKDGHYSRQIGWKLSTSGKLVQAKFRLGANLEEAKRRNLALIEIWKFVERRARETPVISPDGLGFFGNISRYAQDEPVVWPDELLEIAREVARNGQAIVKKLPEESSSAYFSRCSVLAGELAFIRPQDEATYRDGFHALKCDVQQMKEETAQILRNTLGQISDDKLLAGGPRLHDAMRDHIDWLKQEYKDPETEITDWGRMKVKQVKILLERHEDQALVEIAHDEVEQMIRYWRQRPNKKSTDTPITKKSAENLIAALRSFFKWLGRSAKYDWKKPSGFDDIPNRVRSRTEDTRTQIMPDDIFTLEELVLLNEYATPLQRTLLLLGLNCGFARAEIASLLLGEIYIRKPHDQRHQEILGFTSSEDDSFIKRYRRKTGVYGEFILFPQTVQAIEWAMKSRKSQPDFSPQGRLLLNANGHPYDKLTAGGNPNQQIPNHFAQIFRRLEDAGKKIKKRPFKTLRKTAGDLVRRFADGEVAAVFQSRGQPVEIDNLADAYTNRPFGKVFEALRKVQTHLQPMFDAAGSTPFTTQPKACTPQSIGDRIIKLHREGMGVQDIALAVEKHTSTVYRHIKRSSGH